AVFRMEIFNHGVDVLVLIASLQAMPSHQERIADTRIDNGWVLMLRVAILAAQAGIATDALCVQSARDAGVSGQAGDAIKIKHARATDADRLFARQRARNAKPEFDNRGRGDIVSHATRQLLVEHADEAVGRA